MRLLSSVAAAVLALAAPVGAVRASTPDANADRLEQTLHDCAPTTYVAALDCLDRSLPPEAQAQLAAPGGAIDAHFGLGMWIRNNWGLWNGGELYRSMIALGLNHPDDTSAAILEGFAARERGEPYDVAAAAAENRVEAARMWDEEVRQGRAGVAECPMPERASLEQAVAAIRACADRHAAGGKD